MDEWINKMFILKILFILYVTLFRPKMEGSFETYYNLENIMPSEVSQPQKDKYYMIPLMWGPWGSQTSIDRKNPGGCQGLGGGGMKSLCLMGLEFQFEEMKKFCRLRMVMFAQQYDCPRCYCTVHLKTVKMGTPLEVQWLGVGASTASDTGLIPGQGTKIPRKLCNTANK